MLMKAPTSILCRSRHAVLASAASSSQLLLLNPLRGGLSRSSNSYYRYYSNNNDRSSWIRLSRRLGQLDLCSRREGDRLVKEGLVVVNGVAAELAQKVPPDLPASAIQLLKKPKSDLFQAVLLNKPRGIVSGQAEHDHIPAIRLLQQPERLCPSIMGPSGDDNAYSYWKQEIQKHQWEGYAPAGRLDRLSTGLLIMTSSGVLAKKLIGDKSIIEKEYLVQVEPAVQPDRQELTFDPDFQLPPTMIPTAEESFLEPLTQGGRTLLGDNEGPLKPCVAEWVEPGRVFRIILREGKKQQIRRACRQLLGYHVTDLRRTRIGTIRLEDNDGLAEGYWRPLTSAEISDLMTPPSQSSSSQEGS